MLAENLYDLDRADSQRSVESQTGINALSLQQLRNHVSLFGALNDVQLKKVLSSLSEESFFAAETIYKQGQLPCNIYVVLSGEVALTVKRGEKTELPFQYRVGDCFGETAVIGIQQQMGTATAVGDVRLLVLNRMDLMELLQWDVELFGILMMNIAREVSRRLHTVVNRPENEHDFFTGKSNYKVDCV